MADILTQEQSAAVLDRGRALLVSAAAGSGKTRVLVERLFSYVERDGANIDDFLIITYTRAAAAEVRGKIASALLERLRQDPGSAHLRSQMLRVYRADIKTVDAFCTALLRENCHLIVEDEQHRTLRPDFRVLDEQDAEGIRTRVLTRTLERFYEELEPGDGGTLLADTLGAGRDDRALAELVLELADKVQAQPYPEAWLREQESKWTEVPACIDDTLYGALLMDALRVKALHWAALLTAGAEDMANDEKLAKAYVPCFLTVANDLRALARASEAGWDEARAHIVSFPRLGGPRNVKDAALRSRMKQVWESCKVSVGKLNAWFTASSTEAADDLRAMSGAMRALLRLTERFLQEYRSEKRRRNAADFSDQEHEAVRLLVGADGMPTELARSVAARYREILVDEYQDTNAVQSLIFEAISREGKNLFTVGDVKQSIYRFRLADPTIFLERYRSYRPAEEAAEGEHAKLVLSRNFRSRREVLDAVNFVFSNILSVEMGEMDYGAEEALYPGVAYPERPDGQTEFHLIDVARQGDGERVRASEAEAAFVARYIRSLLDSGFPVTDPQTHALRGAREEDVVILMRSPAARRTDYRRALEAEGVAFSADVGVGIFETTEVAVVFAMLEVIDNPRQDVPLISVLRSPLFGFTADRLALLRAKTRAGDFYDTLLADDAEDAARFLATLRELREASQTMGVYRLLSLLYARCGVLGVFGAMSGGRERKENLLAFAALAREFEETGYRGLFAFLSHLRELREGGVDTVGGAQSAGGVRLMSIHSSKGLEFPIVILADLAKPFNNMDFTGPVLVHPRYGLGPECMDMQRRIRYPTAARQAIERTLRRETKAEELRLLYVAMTRAKEKLVLVHTQANAAKRVADLLATTSCPALPEAVDEGKCLGDWVMLPLLCRPEAEPLRALAGFDAPQHVSVGDSTWRVFVENGVFCAGETEAATAQDTRESTETLETAEAPETGEVAEVEQLAEPAEAPETPEATTTRELPLNLEALTWRYPHAASAELSAKLTVTQLKGRALDSEIAENTKLPPRLRGLARPRFLEGRAPLTGAERGTATHIVMEHLDFFCEGTEASVREQIEAMRRKRLLTPEQAEAADAAAIARFLQSDIAARIRASERLVREYRFSLLRRARDYDPRAAEDDEVLVQGVVDCFFEEEGALTVLDFKTDRIGRGGAVERAEHYRAQLEAYAAALARIMEKPVREKLLYFFATGESVCLREDGGWRSM